jgi:hypothetical protein
VNKGSEEGGQQKNVQDKISSESPPGKMLKYLYASPCSKGKKKQSGQIVLFYLDPRTYLKAFGFWTKIWI